MERKAYKDKQEIVLEVKKISENCLFFSYPKFMRMAKRELKNLFKEIEFKDLEQGVFIAKIKEKKEDIINTLKNKEPIFIHNYFLIEKIISIKEEIANEIERILKKEESFKIECNIYRSEIKSRDLEVKTGLNLEKKGYKVDLNNPDVIVEIYIYEDNAYIGVMKKQELLFPYISYAKIIQKEKTKLNRAEFKLREALERFKINIKDGFALDLGSAPGGWVKVLLEKGLNIIAIDKANLSEELENNTRVFHIKENIEERNIEIIARKIKSILKNKKLEIITCDINDLPERVCKNINTLLPFLKKGGYIIMTIKGVKNMIRSINNTKKCFNIKILKIKHLEMNRQEVTMLIKNEKP